MFARFFIDRPIFAWVLSLVILLLGGVCILFLPIDMYPPIIPPTVQVSATYPGANAQVVADTIAAPIEEQVNGVENMLYMSSQSTNDGSYVLTVTFEIGTDPNLAQVLVQNRVALAMPQLPPTVQLEGVSTKKTSPNILLAVNLVSPDHRFNDLYLSNYATIHIQDELARLKGVGDVHLFGQRNYSMPHLAESDEAGGAAAHRRRRHQLDFEPKRSSGRGRRGPATCSPRTTIATNPERAGATGNRRTIRQHHSQSGPGESADRSRKRFGNRWRGNAGNHASSSPVRGNQQIDVVATPIVRVRDVATIEMGAQNYDQIAKVDGEPSTGIAIFQLPGSNALDVAARVKARMEELKGDFPEGLEYRIVHDTTPFIRESVDDVFRTLLEAVLLVALVVLFFLQDWKAMILPMIDVPVSLVGTFAVMACSDSA